MRINYEKKADSCYNGNKYQFSAMGRTTGFSVTTERNDFRCLVNVFVECAYTRRRVLNTHVGLPFVSPLACPMYKAAAVKTDRGEGR